MTTPPNSNNNNRDGVSASSLGELHNDPSQLVYDPSLNLSERHLRHAALVLDIFQGKGTMTKINDNFTEDSIYEDPVAIGRDRHEVAGQLLHIPTVTSSTKTRKFSIISLTPGVSTTTGSKREVKADLIEVEFNHDLNFKVGPTYNLDTTLQIYSTEEGIVRLQDRPSDRIPDNGFAMALRKLNGVVAPKVAGVPKNQKEDAEKALKQGI
ncbi:uncharacterized protein I303_105759 [Kwoniella dejecticola CBS 10117]|uniref:Uncharacterized protein n=1 Tax=Kwoniella dejecticola CBS 10117 TaxID=1296121 RepID=A0A1A6A0A7_9TREE|nr:uncharacterized protein I303_05782 [Kwoniella dejecticola CBS 10117]OBR83502.1 hypothetical protein I303_05782 [Kwoniella dejecticola CBS 10117]